jgi:hypothetical protein
MRKKRQEEMDEERLQRQLRELEEEYQREMQSKKPPSF